jgi:membrane protein implicated in regulation of membrane protease activity
MLQRGLAYAAATVLICAVCAAVIQLAALILSFSSPVSVAVVTLAAVALIYSQRRSIRTVAKHRSGPRNRVASSGRPTRI